MRNAKFMRLDEKGFLRRRIGYAGLRRAEASSPPANFFAWLRFQKTSRRERGRKREADLRNIKFSNQPAGYARPQATKPQRGRGVNRAPLGANSVALPANSFPSSCSGLPNAPAFACRKYAFWGSRSDGGAPAHWRCAGHPRRQRRRAMKPGSSKLRRQLTKEESPSLFPPERFLERAYNHGNRA